MSCGVRLYVLKLCIVRSVAWCEGAAGDGNGGEDVGCEEEWPSLGCFMGFPYRVLRLFLRGLFVVGQSGGVIVGRGELVSGKVHVGGRRRRRFECT